MPTVIKDLLASKKFWAAVLAVAAQVALRFGWELDTEAAWTTVSPLIAYIFGQAAVDVKKVSAGVQS